MIEEVFGSVLEVSIALTGPGPGDMTFSKKIHGRPLLCGNLQLSVNLFSLSVCMNDFAILRNVGQQTGV